MTRKELSIEEKAKAYDEALKVLHKYDGANIMFSQSLKEEMFPELKESEEERIRKALIDFFNRGAKNGEQTNGVCDKDILAWLEKQGEQHPKFRIGDTIEKKSTGDIVTISEIDLKNREYRLSNTGFIPFKYENLWKLVEQKPTDKVKPKFHEGDWILIDKPCQIISINDNGTYIVRYCDTEEMHLLSMNFCDSHFHLWTIQNTKDGDVLYTSSTASNEIFIFKGLSKEGNIECYCSYDSEDKYCEGKYHFIGEPTFMTRPATKEQRDLLFQKMKEAGYEWDAEKKELKKISQRMISAEVKEALYDKPAWNEEDDGFLNLLLAIFTTEHPNSVFSTGTIPVFNGNCVTSNKIIAWLKLLKDKVQPKVELTQLDKNILEATIAFVEQNNHFNCWGGVDKQTVLSALRSIRLKKRWKPTERQMMALKEACGKYWEPDGLHPLYTLYQGLKQLKG